LKWLNGIDAHNALHNFKQDVIKIDTSSYQNIETRTYQNIETRTYQNIETRTYQNIETSSYQNIETSSYQNIETRTYQNILIILSKYFDNLIKIDIRSYQKITQLYASIQLFI
jgi:hypothetical protein